MSAKIRTAFTVIFVGLLGSVLLLTCVTGWRTIGYYLLHSQDGLMDDVGVNDRLKAVTSSIETGFNEGILLRETAIDLYGLTQRIMGKEIIAEVDSTKTVLKGSDGKLYFAGNVTGDATDYALMDQNIAALAALNTVCSSQDTELLYVQTPEKYHPDHVTLPMEIPHMQEEVRYFTDKLATVGVPTLNLSTELEASAIPHDKWFFNTDHHWTMETAFWAYQSICTHFTEECDYVIDPMYTNAESFVTTVHKNQFLGSMGVRTGSLYAGKDDIATIVPNFPTDITARYFTKTLNTEVIKEGSFQEVAFENGEPSYYLITSDNAKVTIKNNLIENGKRILFIKDSFGVPVAPYLACWASEVTILDLRYAQEESVYAMIQNGEIDCVVVMYNPGMLSTTLCYTFDAISSGK